MKPMMFFDGGCAPCRREVAHYRSLDRENRVRWIDISREVDLLSRYGIDRDAAMRRLHALDERGHVVAGASAFVAVAASGFALLAREETGGIGRC